jgi:hypothetical protein
MEGWIMPDIRTSALGGIPFGNNANRPANPTTGQPYFNGETARLELYAQTGAFENIVQEVPGVASVTGAYNESANSGTITIVGTNFVSGAIASAIGTNGVEVQATTTTYNSLVQLTANFTGLNAAYEPFDIKVTNPSNLFGLAVDVLYINQSPVWQYSSGSLGTFSEGVAITPVSALATDPENTSLTFSILSGSLPSGISLNSSTGVISGTPGPVSSNTTYTFTVSVTDGINAVSRSFSMLINSIVSWTTPAGNIGTIYSDITSAFSYTLSANALANTISYSVLSGSLPSGLSLNESTGVISGTANAVGSNTTSTFTIRASDGTATADRQFNVIVNSPIVSGGTVYSDATHFYRAFTSGTSNLVLTNSVPVDYILVAGGGGGAGGNAAGGGAGGLVENSITLTAATYPIVIGSGGAGGGAPNGSNGSNSTAFDKTAIGGGAGGSDDKNGLAGGSGGGGADDPSAVGGAGQQPGSASGGYGFSGGNCNEPASSGGGAGGGGAGGVGATVQNNNQTPEQHYGGIGRTNSLINAMGSATGYGHLSAGNYYFAGGGSGAYKTTSAEVAAVAGGGGTGGNGGSAAANTGGGGGGAHSGTGGSGGSGICIVRYLKSSVGG